MFLKFSKAFGCIKDELMRKFQEYFNEVKGDFKRASGVFKSFQGIYFKTSVFQMYPKDA